MFFAGYVIVGQPRRATGRLGEAITATGILGRPEEYFWRGQEDDWAQRLGVSSLDGEHYERYLEAVLRFATTPNGVFAAKMFWRHAQDLVDRTASLQRFAAMSADERFLEVLGGQLSAVHVRRNCLEAAISLWRAELTGVWALRPGDVAPPAPERLDVPAVSELHEGQHEGDEHWVDLLDRIGVRRITITHEQIIRDLGGTVSRIAALVGLDVPADSVVSPPLLRQADDDTDRFAREWAAITGGCDACGHPEL